MNKNNFETINFLKNFDKFLINFNFDIGLAIPYTNLVTAIKKSKNIIIIAQNCFFEEEGQFTGEISAEMLKSINVKYVLLNHFERRKYFNENDFIVNKKIKLLLSKKMIPIVCCGETKEDYLNNNSENYISLQIENLFKDINLYKYNKFYFKKIIIAYEPFWTIGTEKIPSLEYIQKICNLIRKKIFYLYNDFSISENIRIQYGGGINFNNNIKNILSLPDVDGLLLGRISLNYDHFLNLLYLV